MADPGLFRNEVSTTGILDEAAGAVSRTAAPWLGGLWLSSLPVRLMQVYMILEIRALGRACSQYGNYLWTLSLATMAALVLSLCGRAVYVRALRLSLQSGRRPGGEALRLPLRELAAYVYTALLMEALFFVLLWTFVVPVVLAVLVLFAGLAAATAHRVDRLGLVRPLREIVRAAAGLPRGIMLVFAVAILIAWVNLFFAMHAGLWLAEGVSGWDIATLRYVLRPVHPFFPIAPAELLVGLLVFVGASLAVEPFWLASLTVYVYRSRVRETGEDLRQRFHSLREDVA